MGIGQVTNQVALQSSTGISPVQKESEKGISTGDRVEVSKGDSACWSAMKKLGKCALYTAKGIGVGSYRFAKGFGKGVYHTQEGIYGKKAGILGNIMLLTAFGGAIAGGAIAGGAGAVGGALLGTLWYHIGGGLWGAAKEVVHPAA